MKKFWLPVFAVVYATTSGAASSPAADSTYEAFERQNRDQFRVLLKARRYREAQTRFPQYSYGISEEILKQIRVAKSQKNSAQARDLYELYFALYPLGPQKDGAGDWEWTKHSRDFVQVLNTAAPHSTPLQRTRAATESRAYRSYVAFEKLRYDSNKAHVQRAQQIARDFPRSIFALAALNASIATASTYDDDGLILRLYRSGLKSLQDGGAPARHQIILLSGLAEYSGAKNSPAHNKIAYDAWRKIETLSGNEQEKAEALDQAAEKVRGFGSPDAFERSSALYAELMRKYPDSFPVSRARQGIINNLLSARQLDKALQTVRTFEKTAPYETPGLLFLVGSRYASPDFNAGAAAKIASENRALALFEEIERRFPRSSAVPDAILASAKIQQRRGNQSNVVALWEKVASLKPTDFVGGQIALQESQGTAVYELGGYYTKQENWSEALKWWRLYRSSSFCGNGQEAANGRNQLHIYQCLSKLGQQDEAVKTLEEWTFASHTEIAPGMAVALADHYRQRGDLTTLEKRLQAEIDKNKYSAQAAATLAYVDLLNARDQKDVRVLWKPFEHKSHSTLDFLDWNAKYGGKFLAELGSDAEPFLLQKAPFNSKSEYNDESAWACLLLAKMKSTAVLPVIKANLRVADSASYLKYQFSALALLGDSESYSIVQKVARTGKGIWKKQAAAILEIFPPGQTIEFLDSEEAILQQGPCFKPEIAFWSIGSDDD